MAVDERARHDLYLGLEQHLGAERAETLMSMLPPVGWADVATKHDVAHEVALLRTDMEAGFAVVRADMSAMESRFDAKLEAGLHQVTRTLITWFVGALIAMTSVLVTAIALAH